MLVELEMEQIVDQGGSWIKIMLKHTLIPSTTSKSMFSNSHRISNTSSHAIYC